MTTRKVDTGKLIAGHGYRVLSLHPHWAWSIMFAGKDIENRTWSTPYRGRIWIHASGKRVGRAELDEARADIFDNSDLKLERIPTEFPRRQILGSVELVDIKKKHSSPWAKRGNLLWVLSDPRPLKKPVVDLDGKLRLWNWTAHVTRS
ncbi:MAG: ASCH domain-containing protein [Deltaproteobacteria bacterium]|nr:ASCH domain-containing protein [Deltaproteobacteria bacterium]